VERTDGAGLAGGGEAALKAGSDIKRLLGGVASMRRRLVLGVIGNVGIKVLDRVLALALAIMLARLLGPSAFGVYAQAIATAALLQVLVEFGAPTLLVRQIAAAKALDRAGTIRAWLRAGFVAVALAAGLVGLCAAVAFVLGALPAGGGVEVVLVLVITVAAAYSKTLANALWGMHRVVRANAVQILGRPVIVLACVTVAVLAAPGLLDARMALLLQAAANVVILLVLGWMLVRLLPAAGPRDGAVEPAAWLRSAAPLALSTVSVAVTTQVDVVMLGVLHGESAEVGIYRVAAQVALLVGFALQAANAVLSPELSRLHALGDRRRLQKVATASARAVTALALPIAAIFVVFGGEVMSLAFGSAYAAGASMLAVLTVAQLFNAACGSVGLLLNMSGFERETAKAVTVAAILNLLLNTALIPLYGPIGAAIATAVSVICWNLQLAVAVRTKLGIDATCLGRMRS
jgi:O-antigen/teichoic acid export membrane protein